MRIALLHSNTYHWLAGNPALDIRSHGWADGFQMQPRLATQERLLLRASHASELDRGNLLHTVSFRTMRKFSSPQAAMVWCMDYDAVFPRTGALIMDSISPMGAVSRRSMANALVHPPSRQVNGASVLLEYRVSGGAITTVAGTPTGDLLLYSAQWPQISGTWLRYGTENGKPRYTKDGLAGILKWNSSQPSFSYPATGWFEFTGATTGFTATVEGWGYTYSGTSISANTAASYLAAALNALAPPNDRVTAVASGPRVSVTAKTAGTTGNGYDLVATGTNITKSGAFMSGGATLTASWDIYYSGVVSARAAYQDVATPDLLTTDTWGEWWPNTRNITITIEPETTV